MKGQGARAIWSRGSKVLWAGVTVAGFLVWLSAGFLAAQEEEEDVAVKSFADRVDLLLSDIRAGRNDQVAFGTVSTLRAYLHEIERMGKRDREYSRRMSALVDRILEQAEKGRDLLAEQRGHFWRGYKSRYSYRPQLYSVYVPETYRADRSMPVVITLHGGSSNHNVWLAMNLGNKIATADYWDNFRTVYKARKHPDAIIVSPEGLGQVRWRWSAEQDVFDVLNDVKANYNVDPDRVFLTGLSNGGIGAYTIGLKHAWRFAGVLPLAGVTNWLTHHEADARWRPAEKVVLQNESAITYAENAANTNLVFFHGARDPGFKVEQARILRDRLKHLGIPHRYFELMDRGHDLTSVLWRNLRIMTYVKKYSRKTPLSDVRLTSASSRANRQAWVVMDERLDTTSPGRIHARVVGPASIDVETRNVERLTLLVGDAPVLSPLSVMVDGQVVYNGPLPAENRLTFSAALVPAVGKASGEEDEATEDLLAHSLLWTPWDGRRPPPGTRKVAGLSGPLSDAAYETQVHVYGTRVEADTAILKRAAYRGARGWMAAADYTEVRYPVIPDTDLTWDMMQSNTVVLYGHADNNAVLEEIGEALPIQVIDRHMVMRGKKISGWGVGARFICPNPLVPGRYLIVATGTSADAVDKGIHLPIYLADYIVYNHRTTAKKAFMVLGGRPEIETGFFTENWKLPATAPER